LNLKKQEDARKAEERKVEEEARKAEEEEAREAEEEAREADEASKVEEVSEPPMKSQRCELMKEAIKFSEEVSGSSAGAEASGSSLHVSTFEEGLCKKIISLEVKVELYELKLARRDETIRILKAALVAAEAPFPPILDTQQSQGEVDEKSPVEQLWLEPSNEDDE
jgi:hypothetical protein